MKKFLSIIMVTMFIMGCGTIQFKPEVEDLAIKIAARRLGNEFGYKYPKEIKGSIRFCNAILRNDNSEPEVLHLFNVASLYLAKEIKDPMMREDYNDLVKMVKVTGDIDLVQIKLAVRAFRDGLEMRLR